MSLPAPNSGRRFLGEWWVLGAVLLVVGAAFGWSLYQARRDLDTQESERLQVFAHVVDDNLVRQIEGANKALEDVRASLPRRVAGFDSEAVASKLKLLTGVMPGVSTMLMLDAQGTIVASSRDGLTGKNFKEREYFDIPRRHPDPAVLYVSPPFRSSAGTFVMVVGRVITNPKGDFAGVVTATLDPSYFNVVLRSVLYAPDMRTTLIHGDGKVFLNMPVNERALGMDVNKPGSQFSKHRQSGLTATLSTGRVLATGEDRMVAMRSISRADLQMDKPMVVAISRETSALYRPWRERALAMAALFAMLALGSGLTLYIGQRRRQVLAQVAEVVHRERQAGAERVELALRGADLGLWDLHVPSGRFVVNNRERALLGFTPDEALPQGAWRKLIHPDDRAVVEVAIQPHLRGEAPAYDCEHRMRHKDGHWVWLSSRAMIVERDAAGAPLRIIGTHLDITERKRADAELALSAHKLRESEEQLRQVTDNMPALVSRFDLEQRFCFGNRAYRDWLDIDPASLFGRSLCDVYGGEAYKVFQHHIEAALGGERVVYERALQTPHGLRRVEVTLVPQRTVNGAVQGVYALMNDITARHHADTLRKLSEERLSLALDGSGLALFDWDITSDRLFHSAQAAVMRGEPAVETTTPAAQMQAYVHPEDVGALLARMKEAVKGQVPLYHAEFRLRTSTGGWVWVRARGRVVERDGNGRALRLAGTYADINERKAAESRLRYLAEYDTLTDLPNRALFHDRLQRAMVRAARGKAMALLFLDIDHFKAVNDTLGHEAGDQLLKVFAIRMQSAVRQSDTVARLAGDEFTVILEGLNGLADAQMLANKVVTTLRAPIALAEKLMEITVSIGVALCTPGEVDDASLLRRADAALYEAKRRGRNGYFCDETPAA